MENAIEKIHEKNHNEKEFLQAVTEVFESIKPVMERNIEYRKANILERIAEPEKVIMFRIPWEDEQGNVHVNRGFRVKMNSVLGPYKGGLRFHPSVNLSILKFLAFEQVFKNSLTTLPLGGGKGGSDFDPKGKSDIEVMHFCQSFMAELFKYIGHNTDVPAGDIGVGAREIGYLFGMYKRLSDQFTGVLTGKSLSWGGSLIRPEATGYGCVYFACEMLEKINETIEGKTCIVSGSGNVAQFAIEKIIKLGGKPISVSDSNGFILDEEGIDTKKIEFIKKLKNIKRGRIKEYAKKYSSAVYTELDTSKDYNPLWDVKANYAFPCATQNEINEKDAQNLVNNKISLVCEGANMPTTTDGVNIFLDNKILYAPGKAANAGGVAVSGLEMSQNSMRLQWEREEVDNKLKTIMKNIHTACYDASSEYGKKGNYVDGANIAGFVKVANAMIDQGLV